MAKKMLSSTAAKAKFMDTIYNLIVYTLKKKNKDEYVDCFVKDGSSIMCHLPADFFMNFDIPADTTIEMKFVAKKG